MGRLLREVEIGLWYETTDPNARFEVVAMDDTHHTIEIQYVDGTVEDIDYESWTQMEVQDAAPPDDESGIFDMEPGDHDVSELFMTGWDDRSTDVEQIGLNDTLY